MKWMCRYFNFIYPLCILQQDDYYCKHWLILLFISLFADYVGILCCYTGSPYFKLKIWKSVTQNMTGGRIETKTIFWVLELCYHMWGEHNFCCVNGNWRYACSSQHGLQLPDTRLLTTTKESFPVTTETVFFYCQLWLKINLLPWLKILKKLGLVSIGCGMNEGMMMKMMIIPWFLTKDHYSYNRATLLPRW